MCFSFTSQRLLDEAEAEDEHPVEKQPEAETTVTKTRVLADGTYATETVYTSAAAQARLDQVKAAAKPPLRALILGGDFYTSTVLASTLTKLVLRFDTLSPDSKAVHALKAEVGRVRICDCSHKLTSLLFIGYANDGFDRSSRSKQVLGHSDRRGLARANHELY